MGCRKLKIQDYFILRNSQSYHNQKITPPHTYTYDASCKEKNRSIILFYIQTILELLFQFCGQRTKHTQLFITTYTVNELNKYTSLASLPSVQNPSYDSDDKLLSNGKQSYTISTFNSSNTLTKSYLWGEDGAQLYYQKPNTQRQKHTYS